LVRNTLEIEIDKSVEEVFAYVDDDAKLRQWIDGILESSRDPGPPVPGSTFRQVVNVRGKPMELNGSLLRYDRNRELAVLLKSKLCDMEVTYRFEPSGTGMRIRYVCDSHYHSWLLRLLGPLLKHEAQKKLKSDFGKLQALLHATERTAPTQVPGTPLNAG
jgi:uncharacterized protein YndB with AHSA1/START domain